VTVEFRDVHFAYTNRHQQKRRVLNGVTMTITSGSSVGIIGQEGAGKTTMLQLIAGLLQPDQGSVLLDGKDVWRTPTTASSCRKTIGYAFQFPEQQFLHPNLEKEFQSIARNFPPGQELTDPRDALQMVGLQPNLYRHRSPFTLSMGEARRVAFALQIIKKPRLLLLDEPTAGLDGAGIGMTVQHLLAAKKRGTTIFVATHDLETLAAAASRIIMLTDGMIVEDGPAEIVLARQSALSQHNY
jgi:energy-coupling factor transport system ATP-binding protein